MSSRAQQSVNQDVSLGGALISPTMYRVNVQPGRKGSLEFVIANPGKRQVRGTGKLEILSYLPEDGTYRMQYDVAHPRDASTWFEERNSTIELAPGERKKVNLKYSVPRGTTGSYWCTLKFSPKPVGSMSKATVVIQIPLIFTVGRPQKPIIKVSSPKILRKWENDAESPLLAKLPIANEGEGLAIIGATGDLKNIITGQVVAEFSTENRNLLPGTNHDMSFIFPKVPDGKYRIALRAEIGSRRLNPVASDYVIVDGEAKIASEATTLELPPITVEPAGIALTAPAGSIRSQTVRITNISGRNMTIDLALHSLEQAESGSIGIGRDALPEGLTASVYPSSITLRPQATSNVRVNLKTEKTAEGDLWFGLAITERSNAQSLTETVNGSISLVNTIKPNLEVINEQVDWVKGHPLGVRFAVHNSGNQALMPLPRAAVLENGIKRIADLVVPTQGSGGILPGATLPNSVMLPPDLGVGEYIVEISYQYGEESYAKLRVPLKIEGEKTLQALTKAPPQTPVKTPTTEPVKSRANIAKSPAMKSAPSK